ncbi:MAG: type VI secretion system baseplate subunit TssE [Phycisphaerales bacterium]|nr:MAG: type VI secretion system baseplate subunit TssE [Phycisphaerales bacterium]
MAELTPMDRLQPCLLDRLTDDEPGVGKESRDRRVVSMGRYRAAVLRDLEMLLNAKARPAGDIIYDFDEVARSVLNYGIPDLCGTPILNIGALEAEEQVRNAILHFEPRVSPDQLVVRMAAPSNAEYVRTLSFEIEGELWAQPSPDHLLVKTEVDLETGHHKLKGHLGG